MTVFWIAAALMLVVALGFVVFPLLRRAKAKSILSSDALMLSIYRGQMAELEGDLANGVLSAEQFEQSRMELEQRLLEDMGRKEAGAAAPAVTSPWSKRLLVVSGILIPVMAVGIYLKLGNPAALLPPQEQPDTRMAEQNITPAQIEGMVQKLADRLEKQPNDLEGWIMLGRSYSVLHRYDKAAAAYGHAYQLDGINPDVMTNYADALSMANGGRFTNEAISLIQKALKLDPYHRKALWLAGTVSFEARNYEEALSLWERLATLLPQGSEPAQVIAANIEEVKGLLGQQTGGAPGGAVPPAMTAQARGSAAVQGTVRLAPSLAARLSDTDVLYIFAKAPAGPPMPLAIIRQSAKNFPVSFTLDESMAMTPAMSLASFPEVMIGARVSKSGNAMPQSGDLQGLKGPVKVGSQGVEVMIDQVVP